MMYDLQKAGLWKRISAYLFDFILTGIAAVGFALLLSLILGYNAKSEALQGYYEKYEQEYGVNFEIESEEYEKLSEEQKKVYDTAYQAMWQDNEFSKAFSILMNLTLIITTFGIFLAYVLFEIAIPLILKNGQTLGKKIFGLCLVRIDCVKVTPLMIFVRTILGKFTVETMFPLALVFMFVLGGGLVAPLVILLIFLTQFILFFVTKNHAVIHDSFAQTVVVDMASQMIFNDVEELIAYKKKLHAEEAAEKPY